VEDVHEFYEQGGEVALVGVGDAVRFCVGEGCEGLGCVA
jgi:hypothetical protein